MENVTFLNQIWPKDLTSKCKLKLGPKIRAEKLTSIISVKYDPKICPKILFQNMTPKSDSKYDSKIWLQNIIPKSDFQIWPQNLTSKCDIKIWFQKMIPILDSKKAPKFNDTKNGTKIDRQNPGRNRKSRHKMNSTSKFAQNLTLKFQNRNLSSDIHNDLSNLFKYCIFSDIFWSTDNAIWDYFSKGKQIDQIWIFDQILNFRPNFRFLTKFEIFDQIWHF